MEPGLCKRCGWACSTSRPRRLFTVFALLVAFCFLATLVALRTHFKLFSQKRHRNHVHRKNDETILPVALSNSVSNAPRIPQPEPFLISSNTNVTVANRSIPPSTFVTPTYYTAAYLVSAKGGTPNIRLPSIRNCNNAVKTKIRIGNMEMVLAEGNRHSQCAVNNFPEMCGVKSALEWANVVEEDIPRPLPENVHLIDVDGNVWPLPLIDSREGGARKRKHTLGACLKTMFGFTDWRRLIVYLEFWISQGTTVFLFYIHTVSREVDEVLRIYEQDMSIEIHRIGWGDLPSDLPEDHPNNPNNNVWMVAQEAQKNDCMLRLRSRVKYVITLDTDELIGLGYPKQTTFIQLLDRYFERGRVADASGVPGALVFLHSIATMAPSDTHHPKELTFREFRNIKLEHLVYDPWNRSKPIYKPDYIYDAGVHISRGFEEVAFANAVVPADEARLIHLRAMRPHTLATGKTEKGSEGNPTSILKTHAKAWLKSWRKRVRGARFSEGLRWDLNEKEMMNATNACQQSGFLGNWCPSVRRCMKRLDGYYSTWVRIGGAWVTIRN